MPIIGGIQLIAFFANVLLGVLVISKNIRARANQAFGVFAFGMAGWVLTLYLMLFQDVPTLFVGRMTFAFGSIMVAGLIWFTAEFPKQAKHVLFQRWLAGIIAVSYAALSMSPYMILTAEVREKSYIYGTFHPIIYPIWFLLLVGTIFYAVIRSWIGHHRSQGITRRQYQAIAVGTTVYLAGMLTTNLVIPILFNDFRWNSLGPIFSLIMLLFVAQSLLSYRAFDVRWILKWGLVIPALVSFFVGVIAFSTLLLSDLISPTWSYLIAALILTLIYKPLFRLLDLLASRVVVRGQYVFDDAVLQVSHLAQQHLSLKEFYDSFTDLLTSLFAFKRVAILAFAPNKTEVLDARLDGFGKGLDSAATELVEALCRYDMEIVERDELSWRLQYNADPAMEARDRSTLALFDRWGIEEAVPLIVKDAPVGLLLVGPKSSNEPLSSEDHRLLEVIRGTVAPAMANAARFVEMEKLYGRLLELDQAKSEFINVVSHQFRTPLTAIRWHAELLLDQAKKLPNGAAKTLDAIHERSLYLNATLDRVFDVLALESGQLTFTLKPVAFEQVASHVVKEFETQIKRKRLNLSVKATSTVMVQADPARLAVVLSVLLENAIAYTPKGGSVSVSVIPERTGKRQAVISVSDTGPGIAAEDFPHLFEKFFRGKEASTIVPDGAGLGLFVAKQFVERMQGTIAVTSKSGKGTTFSIRLPFAKK